MALFHRGASEDLPEKSAGRAALSSVVLVVMVGGGMVVWGWTGITGGGAIG